MKKSRCIILNQNNLRGNSSKLPDDLTFNDLINIHSQPSKYCGKKGKIFVPQHTEEQPIRPTKRYGDETGEQYYIIESDGTKKWIDFDLPNNNGYEPEYTFEDGKEYFIEQTDGSRTLINIGTTIEKEYVTYPDQLLGNFCNKISCARCRKPKIRKYHDSIIMIVDQFDMKNHIILTAPGGTFRDKPLAEQYRIFRHNKAKLDMRTNYTLKQISQGKELRTRNPILKDETIVKKIGNQLIIKNNNIPLILNQISMLRAQTGKHYYTKKNIEQSLTENDYRRGSPHYHIISNLHINGKWIEEISQKNEFDIGFTFIRENQKVTEYLAKDFYYEYEWFIPIGYRHINVTRGIQLNPAKGNIKRDGTKYFNTNSLDLIEAELSKNGYHVPLEIYLQYFKENNQRQPQ